EGRGHGPAAGRGGRPPGTLGACRPAEAVHDEARAPVPVVEGRAMAAGILAGAALAQHLDLADFHQAAELVRGQAKLAGNQGAVDFNGRIVHAAMVPRRAGGHPDLDQVRANRSLDDPGQGSTRAGTAPSGCSSHRKGPWNSISTATPACRISPCWRPRCSSTMRRPSSAWMRRTGY